ncbi:MAG TPA: ThiF family adenylyltransferase [Candidatus Dormibacteraeota bacterium]|jgi:molybdopterin/thiamine biosynthesis adenylyltransferase|nr:ThiF family adenylyltransferase [Candidatus Dormibacteraeota bacterium]
MTGDDPRIRLISGGSEHAEAILAALDNSTIRITISGDQPALGHQLVAIALVDLLSRLFPRLDIDVALTATTATALPLEPKSLIEHLRDVRRYGGLLPVDPDTPAFIIAVGPGETCADLYVDGNGWQSYIGTQPSQLTQTSSKVPFGPLVAACLAAAHAFDLVLGPFRTPREIPLSVYSSLLGFTTSPAPLADADVKPEATVDLLLVGAGSIGGAAILALRYLPTLSGNVVIVDPEHLEPPNTVKAILAQHHDAATGANKVDVAKRALAHFDGLVVQTLPVRIDAYYASLDRTAVFPTVLCAVDSAESRRDIQDCLPLEVINAACHPEEISISHHITDDGPCVCCLHMADVLNSEQKRTRIIARDTGFDEREVIVMLNTRQQLSPEHLRKIEHHCMMQEHALDQYEGRTLYDLWHGKLLYAEALIHLDGGDTQVTVATPFVTALAGFMLAAEAVKPTTIDPHLQLGPHSRASRYVENPFASPEYAQLDSPPRWNTPACLCRSPRRIHLMRDRYGLEGSVSA